jgi:hypothetical protein
MVDRPLHQRIHLSRLSQEVGPPLFKQSRHALFEVEGLNKLSGLLPRLETILDDMVAVPRVDDGKRTAPNCVNHELGIDLLLMDFAGSVATDGPNKGPAVGAFGS